MNTLIRVYLLCLLIILTAAGGCKGKKDMEFCEGMNPEGRGIKCGAKFESGDLTLVYNGKNSFEVSSLEMNVKKQAGKHYEAFYSETIEVRPDDSKFSANLSLNQGGRYQVEIIKNGERLSEGNVEIIDPAALQGYSPH